METAIRTENLSKTFSSTEALVSLDLEVPAGEVLAYLGPNGAGKTTTIRLLLGLIRASAGRAEIFGLDAQERPVEVHRRLAYVPGEANLWPSLTGEETLHLLGRIQGRVDLPCDGDRGGGPGRRGAERGGERAPGQPARPPGGALAVAGVPAGRGTRPGRRRERARRVRRLGRGRQPTRNVGLGELLKAGLNVVPPAVFVLGIGGLALGLWPRSAIGIAYGLVVWSFIVETIAAAFDSNHWLRDTSPLLHIAPVPAANPNWTAAAWLVGLGLAAALLGIAAFGRRDLVSA